MSAMAIPQVNRQTVEQALARFDFQLRKTPTWQGWQFKKNYRYAIEYQGNLYPPKEIIRMATGAKNFSGGAQANAYLAMLGFRIVPL
jgi:5-methylcytosine-specific restriction protein A